MKAQSHRFLIEISLKKLIKFIQIHSQIDILYELNFGFILLISMFVRKTSRRSEGSVGKPHPKKQFTADED